MARLVLVGGGHSHIEVLRRAAEDRLPADVVVIDPYGELPYTGMVPGLIAGLYRRPEVLIDVRALCARAGAVFRRARVTGLDPASRRLACDDGSSLAYDVVSIDVGSALDLTVPGAAEHALAVRPLHRFVDAWPSIAADTHTIAVVGAGAAGIELALALRAEASRRGAPRDVAIVGDTPVIAPTLPPGARARLERACARHGVKTALGSKVSRVSPSGVELADGRVIPAERTIWATGPVSQSWLRASGIPTDERGFVAVDDCLRAQGRADIFAAGDAASFMGYPRPKSGVYAVRAAPVLADNLRAALLDRPLRKYVPQRQALALIGTGDRRAVGVYDRVSVEGRWVWRWKDGIDRRFVERYRAEESAT